MTEQLAVDLGGVREVLADRLIDRRQRPQGDGAARLLIALVKGGLDEQALKPAAALAIALDLEAEVIRRRKAPA